MQFFRTKSTAQGDGYHELNKHIEGLNHGIPVFDRLRFYGLLQGGDLDELQGMCGDEIDRGRFKWTMSTSSSALHKSSYTFTGANLYDCIYRFEIYP